MPQILKPTVRENILQCALDRFLDKGYRDTSIQDIAKAAGIATGNIYNYFKSKEAIFSTLADPVLKEVKGIFGIRVRDITALKPLEAAGIAEKKLDEFAEIYKRNRKVFVLLFEKSESTAFETTRADVIESMSLAVLHAKSIFTKKPATQQQEILIRAYAAAYINGIISILTEKTEEAKKLEALYGFLPFLRNTLIENLR